MSTPFERFWRAKTLEINLLRTENETRSLQVDVNSSTATEKRRNV
jgi:hypothetical protein